MMGPVVVAEQPLQRTDLAVGVIPSLVCGGIVRGARTGPSKVSERGGGSGAGVERTITIDHVAGVPVQHPLIVQVGNHYGTTIAR